MAFKKVGDVMKTEKIYCSCGAEIKSGRCTKCGKEAVTKPDIPMHLLKEKEDKEEN